MWPAASAWSQERPRIAGGGGSGGTLKKWASLRQWPTIPARAFKHDLGPQPIFTELHARNPTRRHPYHIGTSRERRPHSGNAFLRDLNVNVARQTASLRAKCPAETQGLSIGKVSNMVVDSKGHSSLSAVLRAVGMPPGLSDAARIGTRCTAHQC